MKALVNFLALFSLVILALLPLPSSRVDDPPSGVLSDPGDALTVLSKPLGDYRDLPINFSFCFCCNLERDRYLCVGRRFFRDRAWALSSYDALSDFTPSPDSAPRQKDLLRYKGSNFYFLTSARLQTFRPTRKRYAPQSAL